MIGVVFLLVPDNTMTMLYGILILGAGCSPIYPNLLYETKHYFPQKSIGFVIVLAVSFVSLASVAAPAVLNIMDDEYVCWFPSILFLAFIILTVCCGYLNYHMQMKNNKRIQQISDQAYKDSFTEVMNKNAFLNEKERLQKNKSIVFTCVYIDINGLHEINNKLGHAAGDELIMRVVQALQKRFDCNHIYRIGGDEFVIFYFENASEEIAQRMREICKELKKQDTFIAYGIKVKAAGQNTDEVIDEADRLMLQNKVEFYKNNVNVMR